MLKDEQLNTICATILIVVVLICFSKCAIEEDRLKFDREKANQSAKP